MGGDRSGACHAYRAADGTWQTEFLENRSTSVCVLAQGPDGVWHAFYEHFGGVSHGWLEDDATWRGEELFDFYDYVGGVAFDADGAMHLSHSDSGPGNPAFFNDQTRMYYSYQSTGGTPHTRDIEMQYGRWSDVAVDSTGKAHVVFSTQSRFLNSMGYVQVEAGDGTIGPPQSPYSGGGPVSLEIDQDDVLHLVFVGGRGDNMYYAVSQDEGATWDAVKIADALVGVSSLDFALDDAGGGHVVYLSSETYRVRYTHGGPEDEAWSAETVDTNALGDVSLALDEAGSPIILYAQATQAFTDTQDVDSIDLNLAQRTVDGAWNIETVDGRDTRQEE